MPDRKALIDAMASVRPDVRKRMDAAVAAILALAWEYRGEGFSFGAHADIDAQVNRILATMSDGILADVEARAKRLLEDVELEEYEEEALEYAERKMDGEDALFRLDMHASHLKELLAGWLVVAGVAGLTQRQTMRNLYTFLGNPTASKDWKDAGLGVPRWGTGYARNVLNGMTVIGQDHINRTYQFARIQDFKAQGAIGYRTVRNSGYDCPFCDEMTQKIWPLDETVLPYHPRCVCLPVPVFPEDAPIIDSGLERTALTDTQKAHRRSIFETARDRFKGEVVENVVPITISAKGIKEALNQPHAQYFEKNELMLDLPNVIKEAKYIERVPYHKDNYFIVASHILEMEMDGKTSYIIARESRDGMITFYSISDSYKTKQTPKQ